MYPKGSEVSTQYPIHWAVLSINQRLLLSAAEPKEQKEEKVSHPQKVADKKGQSYVCSLMGVGRFELLFPPK